MKRIRTNLLLIIGLLGLLLSGCAGMATTGQKYIAQSDFPVTVDMDVTAAVKVAESVFEQQKIIATGSSPSSGYLSGITYRGSGFNRMSFYVMVDISRPQAGMLHVKATSTAGPEVAFTTDLDDIAEDFVRGYGDLLSGGSATR